jgi:hypothetical protein
MTVGFKFQISSTMTVIYDTLKRIRERTVRRVWWHVHYRSVQCTEAGTEALKSARLRITQELPKKKPPTDKVT